MKPTTAKEAVPGIIDIPVFEEGPSTPALPLLLDVIEGKGEVEQLEESERTELLVRLLAATKLTEAHITPNDLVAEIERRSIAAEQLGQVMPILGVILTELRTALGMGDPAPDMPLVALVDETLARTKKALGFALAASLKGGA